MHSCPFIQTRRAVVVSLCVTHTATYVLGGSFARVGERVVGACGPHSGDVCTPTRAHALLWPLIHYTKRTLGIVSKRSLCACTNSLYRKIQSSVCIYLYNHSTPTPSTETATPRNRRASVTSNAEHRAPVSRVRNARSNRRAEHYIGSNSCHWRVNNPHRCASVRPYSRFSCMALASRHAWIARDSTCCGFNTRIKASYFVDPCRVIARVIRSRG